jgi:antitoxin FitA
MATITIRNLDDSTRDALKALGVQHGRSMEAEAREILYSAAIRATQTRTTGMAQRIHERFKGLDFEIPPRSTDLPRSIDFD